MGMGIGGLQPLIAQLGGQGASGNPYVSPALTAQPATPRQGPTPQGGYDSSGNQNMNQLMSRTFEATPEQLGQQPYPMPNQGGFFPSENGAALQPSLYRPAGSGSPAGLSSLVSGSSGSLNSMPSMGGSSGSNGGSGGPFPLQGQYGIVKMANGGLAGAAQNMAGKGRDGDSMLVHMSPGEVKGLQSLALAHGGSLSINPDTGLVEASFLKRILPMIAGAGLMMIPGVGPLAAAGMVGGFETMRTGDIGKGLMAGLGAYGGAGLASGLAGAAGSAATEASAANALGAGANVGTGATSQAGMLAAENASMGLTPLQSAANISSSAGYAAGAAPMSMGTQTANLMSAGAQNVAANPMTAGPQAYAAMPTGTVPALGATVASAMTPEPPPIPGQPEEDERYKGSPYRYNLASNFSGSSPTRPNPYYRPTGLGYAAGGNIMMAAGGSYTDEPMGDDPGMAMGGLAGYAAGGKLQMKTMGLGDGIYRDTDDDTASLGAYDAAMKRMEKQYAAANLKTSAMPKANIAKLGQMKAMAEGGLGSYSDGGRMLKGPGDGMSDDIPAMIGKKQPARLADGEFVVPADVVSHLGNGSTDAGAKKLYSMMDKVRQARTGKKKQAPAVKTDKYLPA